MLAALSRRIAAARQNRSQSQARAITAIAAPRMDRKIIEEHLRKARAHAALGAEHIDRQQTVIQKLEKDGHDATMARELLSTMETSQDMHLRDVERLNEELATMGRYA